MFFLMLGLRPCILAGTREGWKEGRKEGRKEGGKTGKNQDGRKEARGSMVIHILIIFTRPITSTRSSLCSTTPVTPNITLEYCFTFIVSFSVMTTAAVAAIIIVFSCSKYFL